MNFNNIILALLQLAEIGRDTIFKIFNSVDISVLSEDDFFDCVNIYLRTARAQIP